MLQYGYIYMVTHLPTGLFYVGQKKGEFNLGYYGSGLKITKMLENHNASEFMLEFVRSAFNKQDLDKLEICFISAAKQDALCLNIAGGGFGGMIGGHSSESKRKMSESWKSRAPVSMETRLKISRGLKGKPISQKTKDALRIANVGRKMPDSVRIALASSRPKSHSNETRAKMKAAWAIRKARNGHIREC